MALESLSLRTNLFSINSQRNLSRTERVFGTTMGRLSSGMRIMKASDDAAGLSISEKLRAQLRGFLQAQRNANDGISLLQVAEGALGEIGDMLIRQRELAVQSANGTLGSDERASLNDEFVALRSEIDRIADGTEFNGIQLIDGTFSAGIDFQVGIQNNPGVDRINVRLTESHATSLGITGGMSLSTVTGSQAAIGLLDSAIQTVANQRGDIGAVQNRFITTVNNIRTMHENLSAARSRIADADVAEESAAFARTQILMQAGLSVLSQANQLPSMALSLIQG
jgi:flagellin